MNKIRLLISTYYTQNKRFSIGSTQNKTTKTTTTTTTKTNYTQNTLHTLYLLKQSTMKYETLEKINIGSFTVKLIEIEERPHEQKYYRIESIEKPNKAKISFGIAGDIITAFTKYIDACKAIIEKNYYNEINYYYK